VLADTQKRKLRSGERFAISLTTIAPCMANYEEKQARRRGKDKMLTFMDDGYGHVDRLILQLGQSRRLA
jgi:hypothetical protein